MNKPKPTADQFAAVLALLRGFGFGDGEYELLINTLTEARRFAIDDVQLRAIVAEQRVAPTWSNDPGQKVSVGGAMPVRPGVSIDIGTRWQHERDQLWESRQREREAANADAAMGAKP